jgi:hypothetical protein
MLIDVVHTHFDDNTSVTSKRNKNTAVDLGNLGRQFAKPYLSQRAPTLTTTSWGKENSPFKK